MASASVDHVISLTVFIAAILLFISLFGQNMQTAIGYERHRVLSTKTSDLLDTIVLNPGLPVDWGKKDSIPDCFGLQDPEFPQYKLSTFSLMRLNSAPESQVYYSKTNSYYSNITTGFGSYFLSPSTKVLNYSTVSKLLGINGTYGFQLTLSPLLTITTSKVSIGAPLTLNVNVDGTSSPLADASVNYNLLLVNQDQNEYPSTTIISGTTSTDETGLAQVTFPSVNGETQSYAFIVYSHLYGLKGIGSYVHVPDSVTKSLIPLVESFEERSILIAHGDSVGEPVQSPPYLKLNYNASFAILTHENTLRQIPLGSTGSVGGASPEYASTNVPDNEGILIVTYKDTSGNVGIVLMPWGLSSMAFPVTFGANPTGQEWVATDIRQTTIGGFAYGVTLALWNLKSNQGAG